MKLPHIVALPGENRAVVLLPLWDGTRWLCWGMTSDGGLAEVDVSDVGEGDYFATLPSLPSDVRFVCLEFLWKRASWPEMVHWLKAMAQDVRHLAASLAKIDHFFACREQLSLSAGTFVETELEYLAVVCRSLLDNTQGVISRIWKLCRLVDATAQRKKRELPESLGKVVLNGGTLRTGQEIVDRYALPERLAECYAKVGPFVDGMKKFRDEIVHGGAEPGVVFTTERGFCIQKSQQPFSSFPIWTRAREFNNNLVSLRPALGYMVSRTIGTCNALVDALAVSVQFPPDIAPRHRIFTRGRHMESLIRAEQTLEGGGSPWW